ncbi:hypothetical protein D3867_24025 (plasmid) [Azospirillum argentinense]|uniref:Uncharacterized protein n=1 Tax=Azospirillum brasilense TaxID=192 RepID=A0A4D8Q456_AZOBR|nr:hypothetical protein D3867_24025 [Azospirillum argentinense]
MAQHSGVGCPALVGEIRFGKGRAAGLDQRLARRSHSFDQRLLLPDHQVTALPTNDMPAQAVFIADLLECCLTLQRP